MIKGTAQAQRQADEMEFISGSGWSTVHVWHGTKAAIDGLLTSDFTLQYQRISVRSIDNNIVFECRASFGGQGQPDTDELLDDQWELEAAGDQPSLTHHDKYLAIDEANKNLIDQWLRDPNLRGSTGVSPPFTGATAADANEFWLRLKAGIESFIRAYQILRSTKTVTNGFTISVSFSNVERQHTFAQLPAITNAGVALAVSNLAAAGPPFTVPSGFQWSWLKQRPRISGAALGRAQITQEWWLYGWDSLIYPDAAG